MVVADHSHRHERETLSDRFTFLLGWSGGAVLFETRDVACLADVTPLQTRLGAEAVADAARMRGSDGNGFRGFWEAMVRQEINADSTLLAGSPPTSVA